MLRKERKEEREIEKGRKETINSSEQFVFFVFFSGTTSSGKIKRRN